MTSIDRNRRVPYRCFFRNKVAGTTVMPATNRPITGEPATATMNECAPNDTMCTTRMPLAYPGNVFIFVERTKSEAAVERLFAVLQV